ncbi:MAG: hypothetical protein K2K98_09255, partial [Muribaculaceae bacterium]|nr:hypothetical protein [Muribaculaceae bacterium]
MSETKKVKDGAVSTLAEADVVMCAVNGVYHPISFANLMAAIKGNIQIGGRNLLLSDLSGAGGGASVVNGKIVLSNDRDSYFYVKLSPTANLKVGETYTVSFDCEGMKDGNAWYMEGVANASVFVIKMKNGRNKASFVMNERQLSSKAGYFMFDDGSRSFPNGFSAVTLSNFKLERGNMATDYTPAPEDIASGLWGGVIGLLPITYNLTEEGGAHEHGEEACGQAEIGSDGHLSFGTLDSACELIGRVCEDGDDPASGQSCISVESGRDGTLENIC